MTAEHRAGGRELLLERSGRDLTPAAHTVRVLLAMDSPRIVLLADVLSPEECEELIALASTRIAPSMTVDATSGNLVPYQGRTADAAMFQLDETPFIGRVDRRAAEVMGTPVDHGEGLQVIRYRVGGEYHPHFDYFTPEQAGSSAHIARGGQRCASLIMYLNDVEAGGETVFPHVSLAVAPRQGRACYFAYVNGRGEVDARTLHGGNPVRRGEKWIATKWVRLGPYRQVAAVEA